MVDVSDGQLVDAMQKFVIHCQRITDTFWAKDGHVGDAPQYKLDIISGKWARIERISHGDQRSVYAFIAMCDNNTRTLGQVQAGDIHKPAGWTTPAKKARGSVFRNETWVCAGPISIAYLR